MQVLISLDDVTDTVKFEVQLDGLPFILPVGRNRYDRTFKKKGYEVVVKFTCPNIRNNGVFYTDSNGL